MTPPPLPHGRTARRLEWKHLPPPVRAYVEQRWGAAVVHAESQGAGFTPGVASRLVGEGGQRLFLKAASTKAQAPIAAAYATEARVLASLPRGLPATRLLWSHEADDWVVLAFEDVAGSAPRRPWVTSELTRCLQSLETVAAAPPPDGLSPLHEDLPELLTGWEHVASTRPDHPHLADAAALAGRFADVPGGALLHGDVRDDNILLTSDEALLCDWNWPALGPAWVDAVTLLVAVHGDGGDAESALAASALTADAPPEDIDIWLAAFTGFMLEAGDRPVPASSPYLRAHQQWYAAAAWSWLARRRGWA